MSTPRIHPLSLCSCREVDSYFRSIQTLLSPDLPAALRYMVAVLQSSTSTSPRLALNIATLLLSPIRSSSPSSDPAPSSKPGASRTKPESVRAAIALLVGLNDLISRTLLSEDGEAYLEQLIEALVSIFVKGGVRPGRSADLDDDVAITITGTSSAGSPTSVWDASRVVVERLDAWIISERRLDNEGLDQDEDVPRRRTRIHINTTYLRAIFASSTPSTPSPNTTSTNHKSASQALFITCIDLGLSIHLLGAAPSTPSLYAHDGHAASLVWKARKRLELAGLATLAIRGLPSDGGDYERWDGGAGERARLAEEKATQKRMIRCEERAASEMRARSGGLTLQGGQQSGGGGGDLLDAPRRLKGKKIVHQRRGSYSRDSPSGWSSPSTTGPATPREGHASLRQVGDCPFPHHTHASNSASPTSTGLSGRSQSTTSLPGLNKKKSIHLLHMASSSSLKHTVPLPSRIPALPKGGSSLKAETPIPLPTVLDSHGIFSPSFAPIEPAVIAPTITETVIATGSKRLAMLRRSMSRLTLNILVPTSTADAPALPSLTRTTYAGRPASPPRVPTTLPALVPTGTATSSEASTPVSSPTTPILISSRDVPKLAFQPSTFTYECEIIGGGGAPGQDMKRGGLWRVGSPRGERMRKRVVG